MVFCRWSDVGIHENSSAKIAAEGVEKITVKKCEGVKTSPSRNV
jgi:hypothetical protein